MTIDLQTATRNELLKHAQTLGLNVSKTDSKADILAKLETINVRPEGDMYDDGVDYDEAVLDPLTDPPRRPPGRVVPKQQTTDASQAPLLRPSRLEQLIRDAVARDNPGASEAELAAKAAEVDRFKFLRFEGLPAPRRRYRVTVRSHTDNGLDQRAPYEVDEVDESAARAAALDHYKIPLKMRHRWLATVVTLEE